jgi:hypothetical protein
MSSSGPTDVRLTLADVIRGAVAGMVRDVHARAKRKNGDRRDDVRSYFDDIVGGIAEMAFRRAINAPDWVPCLKANARTGDVAGWEVKGTDCQFNPRLLIPTATGRKELPRPGQRYVLLIGLDDADAPAWAPADSCANLYDWRIAGWITGAEILEHERTATDETTWWREPRPGNGRPCWCVPQHALRAWTGPA